MFESETFFRGALDKNPASFSCFLASSLGFSSHLGLFYRWLGGGIDRDGFWRLKQQESIDQRISNG
jgi:hypothetical protein